MFSASDTEEERKCNLLRRSPEIGNFTFVFVSDKNLYLFLVSYEIRVFVCDELDCSYWYLHKVAVSKLPQYVLIPNSNETMHSWLRGSTGLKSTKSGQN